MLSTTGACALHPTRRGVGICVECRRVVCTDCTTRFEGINRCTACLALRREALAARTETPEWTVSSVFAALSGIALFALAVNLLLRFIGLWGE